VCVNNNSEAAPHCTDLVATGQCVSLEASTSVDPLIRATPIHNLSLQPRAILHLALC